MSDSRDFSNPTKAPTVTYDVDVEARAGDSHTLRPPPPLHTITGDSTNSGISDGDFSLHNPAPIVRNRKSRGNTLWGTFPAVVDNPHRPAWEPGQEPGLDPRLPLGGRDQLPGLHVDCDITIVEYSEDDMVMRNLDNHTLCKWIKKMETKEFGDRRDDDWVKCRWINVNGLSWDVISALGKYKKLHRLAVEDMINTKNRTKADWYSDQTYIVMTLQKLVKLPTHCDCPDDSDDGSIRSDGGSLQKTRTAKKLLSKILGREMPFGVGNPVPEVSFESHGIAGDHLNHQRTPLPQPRTLQRYHGGPNLERIAFMEEHSGMTKKDLAVCAEQVSIFLMGENTVISFFESSADDIEKPIIKRLATPETILRRSCDASMLMQAIIDAIIDLAMPIADTYSQIIQELELDVLTEPSIQHTRELYILTSEVTTMRNFIAPIATLVRTMRDHKTQHIAALNSRNPSSAGGPNSTPHKNQNHDSPGANVHFNSPSTLEISPMTHMYLADVEDHTLSILSDLEQISLSAAGLINLIFNTISAYQNESMKQLTTATIIFLPMTFITGYFGMNFDGLSGITGGDDRYFWAIAAPVAFVTVALLMWSQVWRFITRWFSKWGRHKRRVLRERTGKPKDHVN